MTSIEQGNYIIKFIDTYFKYSDQEKGLREAACLEVQFTHAILPLEEGDMLCGRYQVPCVGFGMQNSGMGYYFDSNLYKKVVSEVSAEMAQKLDAYIQIWIPETGAEQLIRNTPKHILDVIPNDNFTGESNVGFWLCRMSSTNLDFDKLLTLGLPGLMELLDKKVLTAVSNEIKSLYKAMKQSIITVQNVILNCRKNILGLNIKNGVKLAEDLGYIAYNKPETFHQATQLMYLYAIISGTFNYGRMDEYLGDFLADDLNSGRITRDDAKKILISLWNLIIHRKTTWDGRVIVGGLGRRNEKNADEFALLAIEVAGIVRDVLPQFTLRFYNGQNQNLMENALAVIGTGCVYPMLYNDDVNIHSVKKAFNVSYEEAINYLPFGCGEYMLYHRSVATPSDIINLLKALEITLFNGYDFVAKKQLGLKTGNFLEFNTFDELYNAYCKQVEHYVAVHAEQQFVEYQIAAKHSPFLLASILYDDCIERGKAIFDGGVDYLDGTLETYGNINTADSLTAIKKLVFEDKIITKLELLEMIKNDFKCYEKQRELLLSAPKYGNDDDYADTMALKLHNHICLITKNQAEKVGLHSYLVVVINNSANTTLGQFTLASADGRKAFEPMANANNPSGGSDKNGLTAMLNSLVKLPTDIHAGAVQNIKFSKDMFTTYFNKTKASIKVFFKNGGQQIMINVLGHEDLENALKEPEKYKNLIVRVGGFSARFVELEPKVQQEVMSRTMY
jgi:pyruvate-formate lyase